MGAQKPERARLRAEQVFRYFIAPLGEQRAELVKLFTALFLLSLAQSGFLLLLGPFLKALFGLGAMSSHIRLGELLSPQLASLLPGLAAYEVERGRLASLVPLGLMLAGLLRCAAVYNYQSSSAALALHMAKSYRDRLFASLLALPYGMICKRSPGQWMSHLMNDVLFLQTKFADIAGSILRDGVVMLAAFLTLAAIHWQTAVLMALLAPVVAFGMGRTGKRIAFFTEAFQNELARIVDFALELRKRFYFMRAQEGESCEKERFAALNEGYYAMIRQSLWVRATFAPVMEFLGFGSFALITLLVGSGALGSVFAGVNTLVFFGALGLMLRPLRNIGEQTVKFQETRGSLAKSLALFAETEASLKNIKAPHDAQAPTPLARQQEAPTTFAGVSFTSVQAAYPGAACGARLQHASLAQGRAVAIVGPSGAGKSTLLKTLAGLLEPREWEASRPWDKLIQDVSMVSQEPFLFDDSLRDNLRYGLPEEGNEAATATAEARLREALQLVNVADEVSRLPAGLDYHVRALGSNLSGGQIQRLVIARALLRSDKTLLLLDEATSAVDEAAEKDITLRLINACHERQTSLVAVTHRLRWLDAFDDVWFMEGGALQAIAPHAVLLEQSARYREFCGVSS